MAELLGDAATHRVPDHPARPELERIDQAGSVGSQVGDRVRRRRAVRRRDPTVGERDHLVAPVDEIRPEPELPLLRRHPGARDQHDGLAVALHGVAQPYPVGLDHALTHAPELGKAPERPVDSAAPLRELTWYSTPIILVM